MALVLFGNGITDARGSVGGSSFSRSKAGAITMRKPHGVNPRTKRQTQVRSTWSNLSQAWSVTLGGTDRAAWAAYAAANPVTNRFGNTTYLSGFGMFCSCNGTLIASGVAVQTLPPAGSIGGGLLTLALTATHGSPSTLSVAYTFAGGGSTPKLQIFASAPLSVGISFVSGQLRYMGNFNPTSPTSFQAAYLSKWGFEPTAAGGQIFVRCRLIDTDTGLVTPSMQAHAPIT
jgi:hypothetical protein